MSSILAVYIAIDTPAEVSILDQPFSINKCVIFNKSYLHTRWSEYNPIFSYSLTDVCRDRQPLNSLCQAMHSGCIEVRG